MGPPRSAAVIGAGQAGGALARALAEAGIPIVAVASRSEASAGALAGRLEARVASPEEAAAAGDLVLVAVPDDATAGVVAGLARAKAFRPGQQVLHCSGVLGLDVLSPAAAAGARIGVLHPVTPLVAVAGPVSLAGKPLGYDAAGDPAWVRDLAVSLGGRPVPLQGVERTLYHAGAVVASNLLVGLSAAAAAVFEAAGVARADAEALVGSLATAAAANVAAAGAERALTGPVRRGDADVIRAHREALGRLSPDLADAYVAVSRCILDLLPPGTAREASTRALA